METEKDAVIRMAAGYTQPVPHGRDHHWYQIIGTRGCVEWKRAEQEFPKMWLTGSQMHDVSDVDWRYGRTDAPGGARGSGHRDMDYYVHATFRDVVLGKTPQTFDVYKAIDTAAPAILAGDSTAEGSKLMVVPDFRPGKSRTAGEMPKES